MFVLKLSGIQKLLRIIIVVRMDKTVDNKRITNFDVFLSIISYVLYLG